MKTNRFTIYKIFIFILITFAYFYLVRNLDNALLTTVHDGNVYGIICLFIYIAIILPISLAILKKLNIRKLLRK